LCEVIPDQFVSSAGVSLGHVQVSIRFLVTGTLRDSHLVLARREPFLRIDGILAVGNQGAAAHAASGHHRVEGDVAELQALSVEGHPARDCLAAQRITRPAARQRRQREQPRRPKAQPAI